MLSGPKEPSDNTGKKFEDVIKRLYWLEPEPTPDEEDEDEEEDQ